MTELNDHIKLLFARAGQLFDAQTALPVRHDSAESIYAELLRRAQKGYLLNGRVIRAAQVIVADGAQKNPPQS